MAGATLFSPLIVGGYLGENWNQFYDPNAIKGEGFVFGALWMISTAIISHRSCQLQASLAEPNIWKMRALAISSYILALLSGPIWHTLLNEKLGFSLLDEVGQGITASAVSGGKFLIHFFSLYKLW